MLSEGPTNVQRGLKQSFGQHFSMMEKYLGILGPNLHLIKLLFNAIVKDSAILDYLCICFAVQIFLISMLSLSNYNPFSLFPTHTTAAISTPYPF